MRFLYFYLLQTGREGLITFEAESGAAAEALVVNDPFLREHLLERHWVKEWLLD